MKRERWDSAPLIVEKIHGQYRVIKDRSGALKLGEAIEEVPKGARVVTQVFDGSKWNYVELAPILAGLAAAALFLGLVLCLPSTRASASPDTVTRSDIDRVIRALEAQTDATRELTRAVRDIKQ